MSILHVDVIRYHRSMSKLFSRNYFDRADKLCNPCMTQRQRQLLHIEKRSSVCSPHSSRQYSQPYFTLYPRHTSYIFPKIPLQHVYGHRCPSGVAFQAFNSTSQRNVYNYLPLLLESHMLTSSRILCCNCGAPIDGTSAAGALCYDCVKLTVDISEGIQREATLHICRE